MVRKVMSYNDNVDGKKHRLDGPSRTKWYENGQKKSEEYYIDGKLQSYKSWNEQGKPL